MGQKLKIPKTCEKPLHRNIRVLLRKKALEKAPNITIVSVYNCLRVDVALGRANAIANKRKMATFLNGEICTLAFRVDIGRTAWGLDISNIC